MSRFDCNTVRLPGSPPQLDEFFLREELPLRRSELEALGLPLV
jgi:hypothetical protein